MFEVLDGVLVVFDYEYVCLFGVYCVVGLVGDVLCGLCYVLWL